MMTQTNTGMDSVKSSNGMFLIGSSMRRPTSTSAGAVAAAGIERKSGENGSATVKQHPMALRTLVSVRIIHRIDKESIETHSRSESERKFPSPKAIARQPTIAASAVDVNTAPEGFPFSCPNIEGLTAGM